MLYANLFFPPVIQNSGTLFIVDDAQESAWLGKRINQENKNLTRKPDKFWIGLVSLAGNGTLQWNSEEGITRKHYFIN